MPQLTIVEDGAQSVYELFDDQAEVTIGRGAANAVQVHDDHASKLHATIRRMHGRWKFVDLESKNGTQINGVFQNQHWLSDGDSVQIGESRVVYVDDAGPQADIPVAAAAAASPAAPAVRAASAVAASPPSRAPASSPSRAASRRRDDVDDEDREERAPARRRKDNGPMIMLLGLLGAAVFFFIMFQMLKPEEYVNQTVRMHADGMVATGDLEGAIAYAKTNGDPGAVYWHDLKRDIERWELQIELRPNLAHNAEAASWFDQNIVRRTRTSLFRAKDAMSEEEAAGVLREFLATYPGTPKAQELLHSTVVPFPEYREMMRANASDDADPARILAYIRTDIDLLVTRRRFKAAIDRLEDLKATQQVLLTRERAEEVRRRVDTRVAELRSQARRAFDADMDEVDGYIREGNKGSAKRHLEDMITVYGLPNLVNEAKLKLDEL